MGTSEVGDTWFLALRDSVDDAGGWQWDSGTCRGRVYFERASGTRGRRRTLNHRRGNRHRTSRIS